MPSNTARYSLPFILIHWVLALVSFVLLGLGWYIKYIPPAPPALSFLLDLHRSLGLTAAILISIQILMRVVFRQPPFPIDFPRWQIILAYTLYLLIYFSFILLLISGYFRDVFSGTPVRFWGTPLPAWGTVDVTLAGFFGTIHEIVAFGLAGLIFVHVGIVGLNIFQHPAIAARMLPVGTQEARELTPVGTQSLIASKIAQSLGKNLRLFGWIGFWSQAMLALISALLLAFATTGRAFNPGTAWFGDALYLASFGFLLSCFAVMLAFCYTRAARKVALRPDSYFNQEKRASFWLLGTGMLTGIFGVLISLTGLVVSISLLIAKTISLPPGTMIMDPTLIVRAIDVIALVVNFTLLIAHLIGTGITLLLGIRISKARREYIKAR
jgi:cytochrome b561